MLLILNNLESLTFYSVMGTDGDTVTATKSTPPGPEKKKLKPCCACPETKIARDACIVERGAENCKQLIEAHRECMRNLGFNI